MRRRDAIRTICCGGVGLAFVPRVSFGQVSQRGRFVFVLLRGGFDGLATVVPYGDPSYASIRGTLRFEPTEVMPLEGPFGLAPGLASWQTLWNANELVALHAMAIPYRTRSHFDGQAVLETGLDQPIGSSDGWLNRLLQVMEGERSGIAVAAGLPRSMMGAFEVQTWSPTQLGVVGDGYLERLATLYRADEILHGRFEAALQQMEIVGDVAMNGGRRASVSPVMQATASILRQEGGPNVAAVEFSGWDTHANQGLAGGSLDRLLEQLADGVLLFRTEMGSAWDETTVVVMTEFGRTARPNGTGGTDHGTAGAGFVIGPRVARSVVHTDWPGLRERDLFDARDLAPTLDTRSILKATLASTFDLTRGQLNRIFDGTAGLPVPYELMT